MSWKQLAIGIGFGAALAAAVLWRPAAEPERAEAPKDSVEATPRGVVKLTAAAVQQLGITVAATLATEQQPTVPAPGALEPDPASSSTVRAPHAGTLIAADRPWPRLGETVATGALLARLQPRLLPVEHADLQTRRQQAAGDEAASTATLAAAARELQRLRSLNADGKQVADRAVEDAAANVAALTAKVDTAAASGRTLQAMLDGPPAALPLRAPGAGECVDVRAHLGEAVDAGAVLFVIADRDHLLARVVAPGPAMPAPGTAITVELLADGQLLTGRLQAYGDGQSQGRVLLVAVNGRQLQPGLAVVAHVPAGDGRTGVVVPAAAIVRHAGASWVFVRTGDANDGTFARRRVTLDAPAADGWFVRTDGPGDSGERLHPGDAVVATGAAALLGVELEALATPAGAEAGK
ncbi:MAG TPA: HlyD family efflux transporter periplasmic adaptor subunit [Planctomycetota bacterium]|nr:HlyD family efflux transporter periplasmic adaptor subunit [Planctomycetota bacterium]